VLPFSVVHVRFVSVECRFLISEVVWCCFRLAQIYRAPGFCYDVSTTFERKRLGPLFLLTMQEHVLAERYVWVNGFL
jgi:hypothetical protein